MRTSERSPNRPRVTSETTQSIYATHTVLPPGDSPGPVELHDALYLGAEDEQFPDFVPPAASSDSPAEVVVRDTAPPTGPGSEATILTVQAESDTMPDNAEILVVDGSPPFRQFLCDLKRKGPGRKLYLTTMLEDSLACDALVDTAADLTVMSWSLYEQLHENSQRNNKYLKFDHCEMKVTGFTENETQLDRLILIKFNVGPMHLVHPVYVSKMEAFPMLLGIDFLKRFEALIDLLNLKIYSQVR